MRNSRFSSVWSFIGLGFVLFLLYQTLFGRQGLWEIYQLNGYYRQLAGEIVRLEEENKELQRQIEQLRRLPFQIEKTAREELGLVRPGDVVYKFKQRSTDK
jgi:cell division protein FtsB